MIAPYLPYRTEDELDAFDKCATSKKNPTAAYYKCFVAEYVAKRLPMRRPRRQRRD
jgi:hypothetical protein